MSRKSKKSRRRGTTRDRVDDTKLPKESEPQGTVEQSNGKPQLDHRMPRKEARSSQLEGTKAIDIALEEYRSLWAYYHKVMGEWKNFIDWYFKVVTLPAALVGYVAARGPGSPQLSNEIITSVLAIVTLVGLSLYIGYAMECRNSNNYERALREIRHFLRERHVDLEMVLVIDSLRGIPKGFRMGSIKFWRGAGMAIINSGVGGAAIGILNSNTWIGVAGFSGLIVLHVYLFRYILNQFKYGNPAPNDG